MLVDGWWGNKNGEGYVRPANKACIRQSRPRTSRQAFPTGFECNQSTSFPVFVYKFQPQIQVASCCWVENLKWGRKRKKIRVILEAGPWTECELSTALPLVRYPCKSTLFIYLFFFQMTSSHNFEILSEPHKIKYPKRVARCSDGPKK